MRIKLEKVGNARKEGNWGKLDIEYTRDGGKASKRTLVAIGPTKEIMNAFREDGAVGVEWEITLEKTEKDGKEYYNWVKAEKATASAAKTAYTARGNYETPEERAARHVSICRQNALTNAVNYFVAKDGKATPEQIIELAREFAAFTTGLDDLPVVAAAPTAAAPAAVEDFADDIPF
jgi:hypothetical protein